MWQSPNHRNAAESASRKRRKERLDVPIKLYRARAEVRLNVQSDELEGHISSENAAGEIIEASVLLNDLSLHGIGIYAPSLIQAGNHLTINLTIELSEKRTLTLQGKVMWCQRSENHRVISQSNFPYRVGIRFQFASTAEEEEYAAFWNQLQKEHLYLQKPEK